MSRATPRPDRHRSRPTIEGLEDRKLLYATLGANWAYGSRITYSFAPDNTNIGGNSSSLFQAMSNRGFTTSQWQLAFQKAASVWEATTNINLALVPDDGSSFGASGNQQGDSRFGDIRIGGTSLSSNVLASAFLPPPINGGSLAGDIVFNTAQMWGINNDYDLQTVAIHEIGHALGMDHSAINTACMYGAYTGMKQSLTSDDVSGIRTVYGARANDVFDSGTGNGAYNRTSDLSSYLNAAAQATVPGLDITTNADQDWYVVTAPANSVGTLTVTMQTSNLSSLSPRLDVFNSALQTIATVQAPGSYGATVTTATLGNASPGQKFYIRAQGAGAAAAGIGAYGLLINFGSGTMSPVQPPNTVVASAADQGSGSASEVISNGGSTGFGSYGSYGKIRVGELFAQGDDLLIRDIHDAHPHGQTGPSDAAATPFTPIAVIDAAIEALHAQGGQKKTHRHRNSQMGGTDGHVA